MYQTYIFDFDYTLADATDGIVNSFIYAFEQMSISAPSREAICKTIGQTLDMEFRNLTGRDSPEELELLRQYFREHADKIMTPSTRLFPDTIKLLRQIKAGGAKTGIVTSKFNYRIVQALEKFNITNLVDIIVGFEDVNKPKPSPEGLLYALNELDTAPADALYTGDTLIDAEAACGAKVDFAAVTTGTTSRREFSGSAFPHKYIAGNLGELYTLLQL